MQKAWPNEPGKDSTDSDNFLGDGAKRYSVTVFKNEALNIDHNLAEVRIRSLMPEGIGKVLQREMIADHWLDPVGLNPRDHRQLLRAAAHRQALHAQVLGH